jgi:hypothetical protein
MLAGTAVDEEGVDGFFCHSPSPSSKSNSTLMQAIGFAPS